MREELKKLWIEALRSSKYEQGIGCLRTKDEKYCCLGVLADLIEPESWADDNIYPDIYIFQKSPYTLDWGFRNDVGLYWAVRDLIRMNDNGKSFDEMADWIEENL